MKVDSFGEWQLVSDLSRNFICLFNVVLNLKTILPELIAYSRTPPTQQSSLDSPFYPEKALLTSNTPRYSRRLLHRSQHVARALATPERHLNLERCIRRPEPDNWVHYLGDSDPYKRYVAGSATHRQRCRPGRDIEPLRSRGTVRGSGQPYFAG